MTELYTYLGGTPLANLLAVAGLACMALAIFGWFGGTIAAGARFRLTSGMIGTLILFYAYGVYGPRAAHARCATSGQPAAEQIARTQRSQDLLPLAAPMPQPAQPVRAPQSQPANLFSGRWKNSDPNRASVVFLKVDQHGNQLSVRAWGRCAGQYCDWGTGQGVVKDGAASVTWEQDSVLRHMKLLPTAGSLRMVLDSSYHDHRPAEHAEENFTKSL